MYNKKEEAIKTHFNQNVYSGLFTQSRPSEVFRFSILLLLLAVVMTSVAFEAQADLLCKKITPEASDGEYDGYYIIKDKDGEACAISYDQSVIDVAMELAEDSPEDGYACPDYTLYINGANNSIHEQFIKLKMITAKTGCPVIGVHASVSMVLPFELGESIYDESFMHLQDDMDVLHSILTEESEADNTVTEAIKDIRKQDSRESWPNSSIRLLGFSYGAIVIENATKRIEKDVLKRTWSFRKMLKYMKGITVETGGAASDYCAAGLKCVQYINTLDPVAMLLGPGKFLPQQNEVFAAFPAYEDYSIEGVEPIVLSPEFLSVHGFRVYLNHWQPFETVWELGDVPFSSRVVLVE